MGFVKRQTDLQMHSDASLLIILQKHFNKRKGPLGRAEVFGVCMGGFLDSIQSLYHECRTASHPVSKWLAHPGAG